MTTLLMACGHSANATSDGGAPACAICAGLHPGAHTPAICPDLTGRVAKCGCGATAPSSTNLAFYEYRGAGSPAALRHCKHCCGYYASAHDDIHHRPTRGHAFEPHGPYDTDTFFCGCSGWD